VTPVIYTLWAYYFGYIGEIMSLLDALKSSDGTLRKFTKFRCAVDSLDTIPIENEIEIFSWPLPFIKNEALLNYLKINGVFPNRALSIPAYEITYETYKGLKNCQKINIDSFKVLRNCISIYKLMYPPNGSIRLGIAWNRANNSESNFPKNTADKEQIYKIKYLREAQYTFNHEINNKWQVKIPVYLGPVVFDELSLFKNKELQFRSLDEIIGKSTDSKGRANRYIIPNKSLHTLECIFETTDKNIRSLLPNLPWVNLASKLTYDFIDSKDIL